MSTIYFTRQKCSIFMKLQDEIHFFFQWRELAFNSIQFNFYFSHVQRDSVQYIKNNKHLYYKGGLKRIRINLFGLVWAVPKGACCFRVGHCDSLGPQNYCQLLKMALRSGPCVTKDPAKPSYRNLGTRTRLLSTNLSPYWNNQLPRTIIKRT